MTAIAEPGAERWRLAGRPIYVEIGIRAPIDELWRRTQDPQLHRLWDLRFTEIEYLPRAGSEAQRFHYATRIGFGLAIRGEGETVGEPRGEGGVRSSALRFWSHDPKSLIREGSGYWKYLREGDGARFITRYDYEPRFAALRAVPRFLRDGAYNLIARTRYRLFGRYDECLIPEPRFKEKFLDAG